MTNNPFPIQPIEKLGGVDMSTEDFDFEDAVGHEERADAQADFIGTSITGKRLRTALLVMSAMFVVLGARVAYLQVIRGNHMYALAEGNRVSEEVIMSSRGKVLDRSGEVIAKNVSTFFMWFLESEVDDEGYADAVESIAGLLQAEPSEVHDIIMNNDGEGELLVSDIVEHDAAMSVLSQPELYPYLKIEAGTRRYYDTESLSLSALLGYTGLLNEAEYDELRDNGYLRNDVTGKSGVEKSYEQVLRGFPGERKVEVDAVGREQTILNERAAVDGADVKLNIDAGLQEFIDQRLDLVTDAIGVNNASVIVMDPRDGAVRALVSYPGYDTNLFTSGVDVETYSSLIEDPARPLYSRAISGQFPSGSTFKPIVGAAALDEGIINEHTSVVSTGGIRIGQFFFPDWRAGGHGIVDVRWAIADSVNTFFYMIGGGFKEFEGLGLEKMMNAAAAFGLGEPLGIDVPGESSGFLPSVEWKNEVKNEPWYIGDTYHVAIGQGDILVTPLQVAAFTAVFANGGTLYSPQVVDSYVAQDKNHDIVPEALNEGMVSDYSVEVIRQGMRQAVTEGSAVRLSYLRQAVAGKTGTAQWHSQKDTHAWFTGFGPYEDPEIVVTVLVEEGGEGSAVAVPLAYDIFEWWFNR